MRVLVAGGTGFLGRALLSALAGSPGPLGSAEILVLSRRGGPDTTDAGDSPAPVGLEPDRFEHIAGDWSEASEDPRILDFAPEVVVNLIGDSHPRSSVGREAGEIRGQVLPFLELIEALEPLGLQRVVFSSSAGSLYRSGRHAVLKEQADTAYHSTKRSIEHYLSSRATATGLTAVSLRISNPIGQLDRPGFGLVGHVARAVAAGDDVEFFGDYATPKDYVALSDVGAAIAAAVAGPGFVPGHHIVDVGSGWAIDAPGMHKLIQSLVESGFEPGRSPLDYGFAPSSLDLEPMARLAGWRPSLDVAATVDQLVRRVGAGGTG